MPVVTVYHTNMMSF